MKRKGEAQNGESGSPAARLLSMLLIVCMMITMLPVTAFAVEGDIFTADIIVGGNPVSCTFMVITEPDGEKPGTVQIGNGSNRVIEEDLSGTLEIPNQVTNSANSQKYNVTAIGDYAFRDCSKLTGSLTIPSGVTTIGATAFYGCSGFNGTLTIPDGVTSIGAYAFHGCSGFKGTLTIPDSVTSIGDVAFFECSGFTGSLSIPSGATTIAHNAFVRCSGFSSLNIPNGVTSIGAYAFNGCSGFTGTLTIPDSVTSIGAYAFYGCSGFTGSLTIPEGVTSIMDRAFNGCSGFAGDLTIPNSVTSIGDYAFNGCSSFTGSLTIPEGVTSIKESAFQGCSGFNGTLSIPAGVTSIQSYAFDGCNSFTSATVLSPAIALGYSAFSGTYKIIVPQDATGWQNIDRIQRLVNAATPVITNNLSTTQIQYKQGKPATALDATAMVTDGGTISYAWYSNTTNSTVGATDLGVTTATYTPSTETVGTTYYYCVVTNTNNAVDGNKTTQTTSAIANIKVRAPEYGSLSFSSATYSVAEDGDTVTITVNRTGGSDGTVTVDYLTSDGTATDGSDYTATSGTLTFSEGETSKTFIIIIKDDTQYEGKETVNLTLSSPTGGAMLGEPSSAVLTIIDNEEPPDIASVSVIIMAPVLGAVPQDAAAVEEATNNADYTVTDLVWNEALTAGGKFKAGQVYTATVTLTSRNGKKFQVDPFTPTVPDSSSVGTTTTSGGGNTVSFTVTYPATGALEVSSIAVTTQPTKMSYRESTDSVLALNGMQVTETNNDGSTNVVTFADGTAAGYTTNPENGAVLTNATYNGTPVVITHTTSGRTSNTNPLTVNTAPLYGSLSFGSATYSVSENGGTVIITVNRTGGSDGTVTVDYQTSDGTAIDGSDYTATSGTLTFSEGETSKTFIIIIKDDTQYEGKETVNLTLSSPTGGAMLGEPSSAVLTIIDNEEPPDIASVSVIIMAPVLGAVPQDAAAVEEATNNADYTVTDLVWNEALTAGGKFKAGQVYTATVTLTSRNGKKFQVDPFTPTVPDSSSVGTTTTSGGGNTVSFTVTYPATGALEVSSIAVTTQPTKMSYRESTDSVLALNGMQVTETNNDGSTNIVTFTDGTAAGYTTNPANGAVLTNATHNGTPVVITHTASGRTSNTNPLTVNTAPSGGGGSSNNSPPPPALVITVAEVKSELFSNAGDIKVEADVNNAFGQSVEVKVTDNTESQKEIFKLAGADGKVYPFDISLYSKGSNEKVQPKDGYSVKITLPVPEVLLADKDKIKVVYGKDGKLETLKSELIEKDGKWYIVFEAVHFSPYALIVSTEPWINPFSDVKEGDRYYSAVQYVSQNGLMLGTGSNTFSPQLTTNRGMIATILYRLNGSTETLESTFKDVNSSAYYAKAVAWAQNKGIIAGYGNGMFGPEDVITREQMATILWRYAGSPVVADSTGLDTFKDAGEISAYAKNALAWANQMGIINGKGNGILDPKGYATRAEVATIIVNYLNKTEK